MKTAHSPIADAVIDRPVAAFEPAAAPERLSRRASLAVILGLSCVGWVAVAAVLYWAA